MSDYCLSFQCVFIIVKCCRHEMHQYWNQPQTHFRHLNNFIWPQAWATKAPEGPGAALGFHCLHFSRGDTCSAIHTRVLIFSLLIYRSPPDAYCLSPSPSFSSSPTHNHIKEKQMLTQWEGWKWISHYSSVPLHTRTWEKPYSQLGAVLFFFFV